MNILPLSHPKEGCLYIDKNLQCRIRSDLTLCKSKEIVGCIHKHSNVPLCEFTNDFLESLLEKFSFKSYSNGRLQYKPS